MCGTSCEHNNERLIYEEMKFPFHIFLHKKHLTNKKRSQGMCTILFSQMVLKLETITKEREMHMEKLWKEFQSVLNSYLKYTEEYRDEYIDLRNRDAEDTRSIQDHYNGKFHPQKLLKFYKKFHFRSFKINRTHWRT